MGRAAGPLGLRAASARRGLLGYGTTFALAACVGVLGGLGALGFLWAEESLQRATLGSSHGVTEAIQSIPWAMRLLLPALGILSAAVVVRYFVGPRHGELDVMEAVVLRRGPMRLRSELLRVLASLGVLGTGGSLGPEGPVVELGAAVGSRFSLFTRERRRDVSLFASCGAAAGLSAAFNAPIGAAIFVLEIMIGRLSVDRFAPVVIASVVATTVRQAALGADPVFHVGPIALRSSWEFIPVVILGILGGLLGAVFLRALDMVRLVMEAQEVRWWGRAIAGGLMVGLVGMVTPHVLGSGFESVNLALGGEIALGFCLLLIFAKVLATSVTLGAGGLGGVFAPTLFLGAVLGTFVGRIVVQVAPAEACGPPGAYALIGMGALVGATLHAPVTAILLLFELSRDYALVPPLMTATMVATVIARRLHPWSLYTQKLRKSGVRAGGEGEILLASSTAESVMEAALLAVPESARLAEVAMRLPEVHAGRIYVVADRRLSGWIPAEDLAGVPVDELGEVAVAGDLVSRAPRIVSGTSLAEALEILDRRSHDELPVVDEEGTLVGVVTRRGILRRMRSGD